MHIHYIGLGKMGLGMVERMVTKRHKVTAFDLSKKARRAAEKVGAGTVSELENLLVGTTGRRVVWMMVPHSVVGDVTKELESQLRKGDILIDGGNSPYKKTLKRSQTWKKQGITYLDIGVSGGPSGAKYGACMMAGGTKAGFTVVEGLVKDLCVKDGYAHVGKSGAGHFVKMVHNGIEYGMMQAIAEGFSIMKETPEFGLSMKQIAKVYGHGSVIESRLMDWALEGFEKYGDGLGRVSGTAIGTGEGKWTVEVAHDLGIADHVIHEAFKARERSEVNPNYQGKIIMALRNGFGGHSIK